MRIILIIMAIVCLGGCDKKNTSIYHNIIFKEICDIARDKYLPFCIVLIDSSQHLSQEYYSRLQNRYKFLTQQAIYNMADINVFVNEWYIKWLCPVTTPLTCVFSPEGDLVDLIPGATRETFLYSKEAINNLGPTDFHWPNYFHRNKKELIPLLNNFIGTKRNFESRCIFILRIL